MRHDNTIPTDSKACKTLENICLPKSNMPRIVIIGDGFAGLALVEEIVLVSTRILSTSN